MTKAQIMMTLTMKEEAAEEEEEEEEEEEMIKILNQFLFLHLINHLPQRKIKIVKEVLIQRLSHNKGTIKKMRGCLGMN